LKSFYKIVKIQPMNVSSILQQWYAIKKRDLPWRKTGSPYFIWLSEVILQQTRVNQGLDYYIRFTDRYPRIEDMANAPLDDVLKLWQGLGYYTRARNMHETAKFIVNNLNGLFPDSFEGLLKLKGIGKYTAAAIASLSFKEPVAVVDGNVFRVLARLYGIHEPINTAQGRLVFEERAAGILDRANPDIHNQALMELGALVCIPRNPRCDACPLEKDCVARSRGIIDLLPLKADKKQQKNRYFNYIFLTGGGYTWLSKRTGKDIWHSLYEFPLIETAGPVTREELSALPGWNDLLGASEFKINGSSLKYKHKLTHQTLHCTFYNICIEEPPADYGSSLIKTEIGNLVLYPVPRLIEKYLADLKLPGRI
jgi:A/G-specific adenine glycosylase